MLMVFLIKDFSKSAALATNNENWMMIEFAGMIGLELPSRDILEWLRQNLVSRIRFFSCHLIFYHNLK